MAISNGDIVQIPMINISDRNATVGDALIDAAAKYGFIYIESKGTGFSLEHVDRAFELVSLGAGSVDYYLFSCLLVQTILRFSPRGKGEMHDFCRRKRFLRLETLRY